VCQERPRSASAYSGNSGSRRALRLATDARDSLAEFFGDLVVKLALASIVYWLLQAAIYASLIHSWIWQGFRDLAARAANMDTTLPGTGPLEALELSLDQFRDGVIGALVKVQDSLGSGLNPISWLVSALRNHLMTLIVAGAVIVILALGKALALGAFCIGAVMFGVGAALGPLFVPLILSDRLEEYFWSWFRFLLVSAATLLVGVIVVLLLADALRPLAGPGGSVSGEFTSLVDASGLNNLNFLAVATKAIVIALFLAYVLAQIPEITNALFSASTAGVRSGTGSAIALLGRGGSASLRILRSNRSLPHRGGPGGNAPRATFPSSDRSAPLALSPSPIAAGTPRSAAATPSSPARRVTWQRAGASEGLASTGPFESTAARCEPGSSVRATDTLPSAGRWLARSESGNPIANSREALDRAAAEGDPAAHRMVQFRQALARAAELSQRRREARARRSLQRIPPPGIGEESE